MSGTASLVPVRIANEKPRDLSMRSIRTSAAPAQYRQAGQETPQNTQAKAHRVSGVGNVWDDTGQAEHKPNQHHRHGVRMQVEAARRIEFSFDPNVTQQAIDHAGHAAEGWPAHRKLA